MTKPKLKYDFVFILYNYFIISEFSKKMPKLLDIYLDKKSNLTEEEIKHEIMDLMLAVSLLWILTTI